MLSHKDNERVTRVGEGTPMGKLFRSYWLPAFLSEEVEAGGAPLPVKLLGERLVAYRNQEGKVGLLGEFCPHRGTSLTLGRNDECGLACIYHGWAFDTDGACTSMPSEPDHSRFRDKIKQKSYPVHEAGGLVWTYMGEPERMPAPPNLIWTSLPETHRMVAKVYQECNYLQIWENEIDYMHAAFAHLALNEQEMKEGALSTELGINPSHPLVTSHNPLLTVQETTYGFRNMFVGQADADNAFILEAPILMPSFAYTPRVAEEDHLFHAYVPIDDYTTWSYDVHFTLDRPLHHETQRERRGLWVDEQHRKIYNKSNNYKQDRELMKNGNFSGIIGISNQDHAVTESMGAIVDRSREHLGTSDVGVIALRRMVLKGIKRVEEGELPQGLDPDIPTERIYSEGVIAPKEIPWKEACPLKPEFVPHKAKRSGAVETR
ncbi:Rieske 2Fe-2S domain-containing protein [Paenibacillus sp. IB182496]|uniref:Rieske 2Fe-2S domain-containing protein n=1 Tax=Paenibacillus sabuli TaxID=2772509 RepID=A0A927BPI9_9BACL|nr:Rieske 2Fe-2S domain-containing protein [Paenibacillus sabuli]MBD2844346.1 Rieske 2Fe-2S domain-containing protein [Paenibacillus sabuli]